MENFISTVISIIIWILKNILWINILLAILVVFFERRDPKSTWLWLMIFFFLPGIGFIFYLLAGQDLKKRNMFKLKEERKISSTITKLTLDLFFQKKLPI